MKTILNFTLCFIFLNPIFSQITPYTKPAESPQIYQPSNYSSPDWDQLIRLAQARQEYERQSTLLRMKQTVNQYQMFSHYPTKISDGWHNVVVMDNVEFCDERKVYVQNNLITKYIVDNYDERTVTFSGYIDKGHGIIKIKYPNNGESQYMDVFFIENIANPYSSASPPQKAGKISFWTNWKNAGSLELYFDGNYVGKFKKYFPDGSPSCGQEGTLTIIFKPGTYNFRAEGEGFWGTKNWEGSVTIYEGDCSLQGLIK